MNESNDSPILYDIEEIVQWPKSKETPTQQNVSIQNKTFGFSSVSNWSKATLQDFGFTKGSTSIKLHNDFVKLVNNSNSWHLDVSKNGRFLAILQESILELREIRTNNTPIVGRFQFETDQYPQWRKVQWNDDASVVAFALSCGSIYVCDVKGILLCKISYESLNAPSEFDYSKAISGLEFIEKKNQKLKLLTLKYNGELSCIKISSEFENGYNKLNEFNVSSHYNNGATGIIYCQSHDMFIVAGCSGYLPSSTTVPRHKKYGLNAWRILSDYPHYKEIVLSSNASDTQNKPSLLRRLSTVPENLTQRLKGQRTEGIYCIKLSPDASKLLAVHLNGNVSIWEIPSLRQSHFWQLDQQPHFDESDPNSTADKIKVLRELPMLHHVISSAWWNSNAIILARYSGNLTILSTADKALKNMLGNDCEWLEPVSKVTSAVNDVFVSLECSLKISSLKRQISRDEHSDESFDPFVDGSDNEEESDGLARRVKNYGKSVLWNLTEYEYFQPPKKRPKIVTKMFRLISFMKTTPENLYSRKIELEEYGAALALAESYNLDTDRVFIRQWEISPVSKATIHDYLRKIKKTEWVLKECCCRVPYDLDAAKELIKFGLSITDLEHLSKLGTVKDGENVSSDSDDEEYQGFNVEEQKKHESNTRAKYVKKWLKLIDTKQLNLFQDNMLRCRRKLLKFSDRISTLEELLGGYDAARERYDLVMFARFREQDILEAALNYARKCDWNSVDTLLMFHYDELKEHQLVILSNFPETALPSNYQHILPRMNSTNTEVEESTFFAHRHTKDWSEDVEIFPEFESCKNTEYVDELYRDNPNYSKFRHPELSKKNVENWFMERACDMEKNARNIEGSLQVLKVAMSNGFSGVAELRKEIGVLGTLVYECGYDVALTLTELQQKSNLQKLKMLLKNSTSEMFIKNVHRWAIPFLNMCEEATENSYYNLLKEYLVEISSDDLTFPYLMLQSSCPGKCVEPIIKTEKQLMEIVMNCIYEMSNALQVNIAQDMVDCIQDTSDSKISMLKKQIYVCKIMSKQGVKILPLEIKEIQDDRNQVYKLFVRMARSAANRQPAIKEYVWNEILSDMLELRNNVFSLTCGLESAICLEVFVESLLTSGSLKNLKIGAKHMMTSLDEENTVSTFNNPKTVTQKLSYESSIVLVINSAQEFFDASSPTSDNEMLSTARECLLIIKDKPPKIQEFLDLIEGVVMLKKFQVNVLPLQVRIMTDRLPLLDAALNCSKDAYKKADAFLRLGMLLRIYGSNKRKRKGTILVKAVERALEVQDYFTALFLCKELVVESYTDAWKVCLRLIKVDEIDYVHEKRYLLDFVACSCDGSELPIVMKLMNKLNAEIIRLQVQSFDKTDVLMDGDDEEESNLDSGQFGDFQETPKKQTSIGQNVLSATASGTKNVLSMTGQILSATGHTTASVLSSTTSRTKEMLSNIQDNLWLKNTVTSTINTLTNASADVDPTDMPKKTSTPFENQLFDDFYDVDSLSFNYFKFGMNLQDLEYAYSDELALACMKLQLAVLNTPANDTGTIDTNLLLQMISQTLPCDFALGLGYLLNMQDLEDIENYLNDLPTNSLTLQICVYYYSIQFLSKLYKDTENEISPLYLKSPQTVIELAIDVAQNINDYENVTEVALGISKYLLGWKCRLIDYTQAEKLESLGKGINLSRFTKDNKYRDETVVGLAMTDDIEQYKLAVSLAQRFGADLWLILATHLEYLFTDCNDLTTTDLKERIENLQMIPELTSRPAEFFARMDNYIYPFIDGVDHDKLLLYYFLLHQCESEISICHSKYVCKMMPNVHIKTLKKIKSTCPTVDYKDLITDTKESESEEEFKGRIFQTIDHVLTKQTIPMFVKLLPSISYSKFSMDLSSIYKHVAEKQMSIDDKFNKENELEWLKKYESCTSLLQQLNAKHLLQFAKKVLFSESSIELIPIKARRDICKAVLKLARNQAVQHKKGKLPVHLHGEEFNEIIPKLQQMSRHLDSYATNFITDLSKSFNKDKKKYSYFKLYDESQGNADEILKISVLMLEDGCSSQFVKKLLAVSPGNKWKLADVLNVSVSSTFNELLNGTAFEDEVMTKIRGIVKSICIDELEKSQGNLTSHDIVSKLRSYCTDSAVPVKLRVNILKHLEESFHLEKSEASLLLFHRTSAIITSQWQDLPNHLINAENTDHISDENHRYQIIKYLLETENINDQQKESLISLLEMWPKFSQKNIFAEVWKNVLLILCNSNCGGRVVDLLKSNKTLNMEEIIAPVVKSLIENKSILASLKTILITNTEMHFQNIPEIVKSVKEIGPGICDFELLKLLLEKNIAHWTIGTKFYSCLVEYLLSENCENAENLVNNLVRKLQDKGHVAEAATLLLNFKGSHPAMRTFGTAMSFLSRWLQS